METLINQPVCESRESDKVVKFITEKELKNEIVNAIGNGNIWGVYYENGDVVAEDIWGEIHTDIINE